MNMSSSLISRFYPYAVMCIAEVSAMINNSSNVLLTMELFFQVSKSPSDLEIVLTIIRNNSRGFIGRESLSVAKQQLNLLEVWETYFCPLLLQIFNLSLQFIYFEDLNICNILVYLHVVCSL